MSVTNKTAVEEINAAFAANDIETFLSFCAEDVEWTIVGERSIQGKEEIRAWMGSMDIGPPQFTVDETIAESDSVVVHGSMIMVDDGKPASYSYCDIYRFRDGKVVKLTSFVVKTKEVV